MPETDVDLQLAPAYLNGSHMPLGDVKIPALDRGFIFGDGVYEVVPVYARRPFRWAQHFARLQRSLAAIRIADPYPAHQWQALIERLIAAADFGDQMVYLQVTRGVAKRDFNFPIGITPTVFAMTSPLPRPTAAMRDDGLRLVSMPDERWLHCDIKAVSLLGAVLARQHATDRGADEALQLRDGWLTEGSSSNIWVVRAGRLLAPPRDNLILEGVRYGFIEELARAAQVPFEVRRIARDDVFGADELMLSSATREILPVTRLDGAAVGNGRPGPIYRRLRDGYDAAIAALVASTRN